MSQARRVLLLNYEFPPMGGGAAAASFQLAQRLARRGHRVEVVTSRVAGQAPVEDLAGFRVHRVRSLRRGIQDCGFIGAWSYLAFAWPECRRLLRTQRFDVVHYFFSLPTGALAFLLPGLRRIPSVVSLRGSDVPGYDPDHTLLRASHALLRPLTRHLWRQTGRVVANSEGLRELADRVDAGCPIHVIPNGIDTARFHGPPRRAAEEPQGPVRLLAVARLIQRKGLGTLLEAVARLRELPLELTIQGDGPEAGRLREHARRLGVADRIHFAGFTERSNLPQVYRAHDAFVLPSYSESCAMALLEAMASELPVVVTGAGSQTDHVKHEYNGLVAPPRDAGALAKALRRIVQEPDLRTRLGTANGEIVRMHYGWDTVASRYLDTYEQVIAETRQRPAGDASRPSRASA